MNLTAKRLHYVLLGLSALALVVVLAGAYGADVLLKHQTKTVHKARLDSLVLERQQQQLTKAKGAIGEYEELADIARHIVPQDKDQAQTVREIVGIAQAHNIKLSSIAFPSSSLGDSQATQSQLTPVDNIPGVFSLEITVQSDSGTPVSYSDFLNFLDALEHNRRTALVKNISLQPNTTDANLLTFSLTLMEYIKP